MPSSFDLTAAGTCLLCPVFTVLPTEVQEAGGVNPDLHFQKSCCWWRLHPYSSTHPVLFSLFWPHPRIGTRPPLLTSCPRALLERGCPALGEILHPPPSPEHPSLQACRACGDEPRG